MEKWFRDALHARVRDDIRREHRSLDDLERLRARVAQQAIAVLSGDRVAEACAVGSATGTQLSLRVSALRQALLHGSEQMKRRHRLLYPTEVQIARCDEGVRRLMADLGGRYARAMNTDLPQCLAILVRAASRFKGRRE